MPAQVEAFGQLVPPDVGRRGEQLRRCRAAIASTRQISWLCPPPHQPRGGHDDSAIPGELDHLVRPPDLPTTAVYADFQVRSAGAAAVFTPEELYPLTGAVVWSSTRQRKRASDHLAMTRSW